MDITTFVVSHRDNALLVGDYSTYRAQLSRKLHSTRKRLGQTTPKGKKYTGKPVVTAENVAKNTEFAHILLLSAERAWAMAMYMKSTHSADTSAKGIIGSARRHIISRLNKAVTYANQLVVVCQDQTVSHATNLDLLEARAYLASLLGAFWMEKKRWDQSLQQYSLAQIIYSALGKKANKDTFRDLLSSTIEPGLRYASYQMKLPRTTPLDVIAIQNFPSDEDLRSKVTTVDPDCLSPKSSGGKQVASGAAQDEPQVITWRSRTVNIEDASISQALAAASTAESQLSEWLSGPAGIAADAKEKAANYDSVIIASQDAVDATKTAIDELTSEGVDQGDKRMQALQVTRTAVNYALITWRVGRNRVLCGPGDGLAAELDRLPTKPKAHRQTGRRKEETIGRRLGRLRERVALYDAILQSLDFIRELPGVAGDAAFVQELEAKRSYFQSLRCIAAGKSHAILSNPKNALALYARALDLASKTQSASHALIEATQGPPKLDISASEAEALYKQLRGLVWQYRGIVELESLASDSQETKTSYLPPMIERLHEYPSGEVDLTNLVSYPPKIEPIPVKPLFLDVAWNYIEYPRGPKETVVPTTPATVSAEARLPAEPQKDAKRGWFGFGR
ncbi:hypothetical protein AJ80_04490 [Polytolypa hystricis UAMH7299]|uniref:Signal recognition particle subunit SRP68 n=1 Tax=Polytolypa hystricis (strain UAMH7299) TaxID=1447883 RepID=A0A2B7YBR7_POLH7|nr:hypothetical protein AJ80_04490 [Polytolypa hystricis UAMH7299]